MFRIAVLLHRPGVVYYHLLLRRETRMDGLGSVYCLATFVIYTDVMCMPAIYI